MKNSFSEEFDIVVIGGGHAGCEAALASARLGSKTLMLVTDIDSVAMMPCNPAIGGTGKGHLVREIDALGGEMGINIDKTFIQSRMLNTAKGPAVHSLRAQADKAWYHSEMLKTIESQDGLTLREEEAVDLIIEDSRVVGVVTTEASYATKSVVIATGTFLRGKIFIGENVKESGPAGMKPAKTLAENLEKYGLPLRRFKTGTPARAIASTFDYEKMCQGEETLKHYLQEIDDKEKRGEKLTAKDKGSYRDMRIVQEMYARGFEFIPMDLYKSDARYFQIVDGKLLPPFSSIDGMGDTAAESLAIAASQQEFLSIDDMKERGKVSQTICDTMKRLGLLKGLPESNQLSMFDFM